MRLLHTFLLLAILTVIPLFAQKEVDDLTFWNYSRTRESVIKNDKPIRVCEIYHDELDLLENTAKFGHIKILRIKGRSYNDSIGEFPEQLMYLDSLETFSIEYVNGVNWAQLYGMLSAIPTLRTVKISGGNGNHFTPTIAALQQITRLEISGSYGAKADAIALLPQLEELELQCGLEEFPQWLCTMPHLKRLDLSINSLRKFPADAGRLRSLRYLNISWNGMRAFPEFIVQMDSLEELDLSRNWIRDLPPGIVLLHNLKFFRFALNWIKELPEGMEQMRSLRELDVSLNRIRHLPAGLAGCDALKKLFCWSTHFDSTDKVLELLIYSSWWTDRKLRDTIANFYSHEIKNWDLAFPQGTYMATRAAFVQDVRTKNIVNFDVSNDVTFMYFQYRKEVDIDEFTRWRERKNPLYNVAESADIYYYYPVLPFGYKRFTHLKKVTIDRDEPWMSTRRLLRPLKNNPIEELDITDEFMRKVPRSIRKMKSLKKLTLNCPGVKELPEWLAELPNLRELVIYKDVMVPEAIKHNTRIKISYL